MDTQDPPVHIITECKVPLTELALNILLKYNYKLPVVSRVNTSIGWRRVCKLAGINESILIVNYKGGERIDKRFEKWEKVSTHTARRTFATLVYNRTKNIKLVSKLLGHASIETTSKYLKLDDEELFNAFG